MTTAFDQLLCDYPHKKARDLRSAMAEALAEFVRTITFTYPYSAQPTSLGAVYKEWAEFERKALSSGGPLPVAAVLPDRVTEADSSLVPRLLEETWCQTSDGTQGLGLFAVSTKEMPAVLMVRAYSKPQRQAIISAVEDAFFDLPVPGKTGNPFRYGKVLDMPSYYDRTVTFSLENHQLLDNASSAAENRWMVQFELTGIAEHVLPCRVPALDARVSLVVDQESA